MFLGHRGLWLLAAAIAVGGCAGTGEKTGSGVVAGTGARAAAGSVMDRQEKALREALAGAEAGRVRREGDGLSVTLQGDATFAVDSAVLQPGALQEIHRVAQVLLRYPHTRLLVVGHTDSTGAEHYNRRLSERRAEAVKDALVGRGVGEQRIAVVGRGEAAPIADNGTPEGRQRNRRVEIRIQGRQG